MLRFALMLVLAAGAATLLPGCGPADSSDPSSPSSAPSPVAAADTPAPRPQPLAERKESVQSDLYSFDYLYPAQVAAIPALRDLLERRIAQEKVKIEAAASDSRGDARANSYPFQPHYFDLGWAVMANLPGWLSLQADVQTYGGGAHPNHGFDALVWDRRAGRALAPLDLFTSAQALDGAVRERYCAALDKERAERREQSVDEVRQDEMWKCPGVAELVIVPLSKGGKGFDNLLLLAAPYVAGAYAEGSYTIEIPVDAAVLGAVKPEYREAFRQAQ